MASLMISTCSANKAPPQGQSPESGRWVRDISGREKWRPHAPASASASSKNEDRDAQVAPAPLAREPEREKSAAESKEDEYIKLLEGELASLSDKISNAQPGEDVSQLRKRYAIFKDNLEKAKRSKAAFAKDPNAKY